MSITDQRTKYCIDCAHAVWPQESLGECHHPAAMHSLTMDARDLNGICGSLGKLYEAKKDD